MNQTTTPGAARSAILWNRLRTFLSKPHNVILLLMGIVVMEIGRASCRERV